MRKNEERIAKEGKIKNTNNLNFACYVVQFTLNIEYFTFSVACTCVKKFQFPFAMDMGDNESG